ncbi:MAG: histidinol dehydrogenase, partial [Paracoccaceae bacterium]|nr:histidinol dehydrogenase [Paracoccaceae bacterium]
MSIEILKEGISEEQKSQDEQKTREIVSDVLTSIKTCGDSAVREYSEKLDNYSPASFRLSDEQIQDCINQLSDQVIHDIKFAQTQIREFAKAQKDALQDIEVEPIPGVILGHKNIP